jgi:hypothetical protein
MVAQKCLRRLARLPLVEVIGSHVDTFVPEWKSQVGTFCALKSQTLLSTCMVRFELKTLLMHYKHSVEFIQGTPVKDSDLDRVSAKVASAFYLLADQQAKVKPLKLSQCYTTFRNPSQ